MENEGYPLQEAEIQKYWLVLKRRWLFVAVTVAASVGVAGIFIVRQHPEYRANGMLLFKSDRISSLTKAGEKIGDLESLMRQGNPLETQAVIVDSEPVLEEVIRTLDLKDKKGHPLDPDQLKIKIEAIPGTDVLKVSYVSINPELAKKVVNQVMQTYVDKNIESNRTQVYAAGEFIKKQLPFSRAELESASEALRRFKTENKIIQLSQESTAGINNIAQLDEQINQSKASLADISAQEALIASQLNMQSKEAVEVASVSQMSGVQDVLSELQKVETKLAAERGRYTNQHPSIVYLKNQQAALKSILNERAGKALGTTDNISTNKLQVGKIKQDLAVQYLQFQGQRQGLEKKIRAMEAVQANYQQRLNVIPNLEKNLGDLERRQTLAQTNFQNLQDRLQEIEIAEKQTIGNARIIQPARLPNKPVLSRLTLLLAAGSAFAGLLFGVSIAFFVDLIDNSLKTIKETEAFFEYPLLGLIPKFESNNQDSSKETRLLGRINGLLAKYQQKNQIVSLPSTNFDSKLLPIRLVGLEVSNRIIVASAPHTVIHDAYQMLQANLKFISHKKVCTLAITSSVAGEGKSEVAANLAAALAQSGRQVLLVDADMRQPAQHRLWGLINSVGLSNVIVGQSDFLLSKKVVNEHLSILTAGVRPPNPLALIESDRMASLISTFAQDYDYVIFDTPPLAGTADAAILGKMVDGVLLVARPGVVNSASAKAAKSLLERSSSNVLGIVANAVNLKHEPDSYFYYSDRNVQVAETEMEVEEWVYK
ncbi:capsular exopolysaccharide family protein [Calothrix sp. NIES-4071]|nr:capsular exopolysaccharide family protein [Calothrix sp. NIES-4071]BAZ54540.1 capsular exopolysaccharide family protein [Calothrix sp. NIES-4105]